VEINRILNDHLVRHRIMSVIGVKKAILITFMKYHLLADLIKSLY
jgi:hypothetical protein